MLVISQNEYGILVITQDQGAAEVLVLITRTGLDDTTNIALRLLIIANIALECYTAEYSKW